MSKNLNKSFCQYELTFLVHTPHLTQVAACFQLRQLRFNVMASGKELQTIRPSTEKKKHVHDGRKACVFRGWAKKVSEKHRLLSFSAVAKHCPMFVVWY